MLRRPSLVTLCLGVLLATSAQAKEQPGAALGEALKRQVASPKGTADARRAEVKRQRASGSWDWEKYRRAHDAYREDCDASRTLLNRIIASASLRSGWTAEQKAQFQAEVDRAMARLDADCAREKLAKQVFESDRRLAQSAFEDFDQRANQLYTALSTVLKTMNQWRRDQSAASKGL